MRQSQERPSDSRTLNCDYERLCESERELETKGYRGIAVHNDEQSEAPHLHSQANGVQKGSRNKDESQVITK